jgi:hypothetical protein
MYAEQVSENRFSPEIQLCSINWTKAMSYDALPTSAHVWREYETSSPISPELAKALQKYKNTRPIRLTWRWETFSY